MTDPHPSTAGGSGPVHSQMYDQIMADIEPDLMLENLDGLKEKYKDETPEQAQERADRYNSAFAAYDKRFGDTASDWGKAMKIFQRVAFQSTEKSDREAEKLDLDSIAQSISNS